MEIKPRSINKLENGCITFINSEKYIEAFLKNYKEKNISDITIVTTKDIRDKIDIKEEFIICDYPRLAFAEKVNEQLEKEEAFIHPTAFIGENVKIGENVTIHPYVVIYRDTEIGNNVIIHSNSVIGKPGYGYVRNSEGKWIRFPQISKVIIEDDVEIGSFVAIDRGALEDTIIGEGTKIDNLVHVAHGVKTGKNCMLIACCEISGSVTLGDNVWVAPNACVRENLTVGDHSLLGIGTVVVKDVPKESIIVGNPGKPLEKVDKEMLKERVTIG